MENIDWNDWDDEEIEETISDQLLGKIPNNETEYYYRTLKDRKIEIHYNNKKHISKIIQFVYIGGNHKHRIPYFIVKYGDNYTLMCANNIKLIQ